MKIEVQFDGIEEMMGFAREISATGGAVNPKSGVKKEHTKPENPIPSESVTGMSNVPEDITQEEQSVPGEEIPTYTLEQVRAKLTALTRAGKQKEVKAILGFFKAKNVTALDPKDYAGVMEKAGAL